LKGGIKNKMDNILLIEDNPNYQLAADEVFSNKGIAYDLANDYYSGNLLLDQMPSAAIIDCFMHEDKGSKAINHGEKAIAKMKEFLNPSEPKDPLACALKNVSNAIGLEGTKYLAKLNKISMNQMDNYHALDLAIKENPSNQPLGILLAEQAEELGIPFVLATSTNHHGVLTQPITNYAYKKGWTLIDSYSGNGKDDSSFWKKAYDALEQKL
jgi:CheY-like chemotaxis protein